MLLHFLEKSVDWLFKIKKQSYKPSLPLHQYKLIAHRGAHDKENNITENTIRAFDNAKQLGCHGIEFDIQLTKDNIIVVHHDADLMRLWGLPHRIDSLTYDELNRLVKDIPTLTDIIERFGKTLLLFIELKTIIDNTVLKNALHQLTPMEDYYLLSLKNPFFQPLSAFPNACKLLVAEHNNLSECMSQVFNNQYGGLLGHFVLLTKTKTDYLITHQKKTGVGQINSKYALYRTMNRGIPWIFSDNIKAIADCLN